MQNKLITEKINEKNNLYKFESFWSEFYGNALRWKLFYLFFVFNRKNFFLNRKKKKGGAAIKM